MAKGINDWLLPARGEPRVSQHGETVASPRRNADLKSSDQSPLNEEAGDYPDLNPAFRSSAYKIASLTPATAL